MDQELANVLDSRHRVMCRELGEIWHSVPMREGNVIISLRVRLTIHECRLFRLQTELISHHIGYLCRPVNNQRCNNLLLCGWLLHLDLHYIGPAIVRVVASSGLALYWLCRLRNRNCNRLNRWLLLLLDKPMLLLVLDGHLLLLDGLINHHPRLETHHLRHVVGSFWYIAISWVANAGIGVPLAKLRR